MVVISLYNVLSTLHLIFVTLERLLLILLSAHTLIFWIICCCVESRRLLPCVSQIFEDRPLDLLFHLGYCYTFVFRKRFKLVDSGFYLLGQARSRPTKYLVLFKNEAKRQ